MSTPGPVTILIVEDDPGIADLQRRHLQRAGYAVAVAHSAAEGLAATARQRVDLVLLDFHLPDGNGLEFCDRLRAGGLDLPVILVTGRSDEQTILQALRAHVRDFVTKSVEYLDYLPQAVGRVLQQVGTERRLAESEALLAAVFGTAQDAILITEADRTIRLFNAAAERLFRCPAAEAVGKPLSLFIPPGPGPEGDGRATWMTPAATDRPGSWGVRADGEEFPLEATFSRAEVGGRRFYTVVARDVTERFRREARLREQAMLLDMARDAIKVADLADRIRSWNAGAERLYGWAAAEALGQASASLLHRGDLTARHAALGRVTAEGAWVGELEQVTRDGRAIAVECHWSLVRDAAGQPQGILMIHTDVTERKKLEAQLRHAQRMEGIGLLAGGVAHDFNNLLTIILGYSEVLLTDLKPGDRSYDLLREVHRAGERAATLTQQLLAFSRKTILQPQILDLNALVTETEKMLRRLIGEDLDLATALAPDLGRVRADPGQLEQILINLAVNARDAMPTGGQLTIETATVDLDEAYARQHVGVRPGRYVLLAVTDTGHGMDAATQARIFEPFFTTKEVGKGTGLGLAMVYGIVQQSGGHVGVYSEPGRGTTFKIYLPVAEGVPPAEAAGPAQLPRGSETILLAEDERATRAMVRYALQAQGYTVLETGDGEEAVRLCQAHSGPLHLLMTDVVMPRLSGRQLAERVAVLRPGVKVLYLSGYTDDAVVRHGVVQEGVAFLQKPFSLAALARKVREVLDGRG